MSARLISKLALSEKKIRYKKSIQLTGY